MLAWAHKIDVSLPIDCSLYFSLELELINMVVHLQQLFKIFYQQFSPSNSETNTGLIVGASVGGIFFLIIVITVIIYFIKKPKRK